MRAKDIVGLTGLGVAEEERVDGPAEGFKDSSRVERCGKAVCSDTRATSQASQSVSIL